MGIWAEQGNRQSKWQSGSNNALLMFCNEIKLIFSCLFLERIDLCFWFIWPFHSRTCESNPTLKTWYYGSSTFWNKNGNEKGLPGLLFQGNHWNSINLILLVLANQKSFREFSQPWQSLRYVLVQWCESSMYYPLSDKTVCPRSSLLDIIPCNYTYESLCLHDMFLAFFYWMWIHT